MFIAMNNLAQILQADNNMNLCHNAEMVEGGGKVNRIPFILHLCFGV